MRTFKGVDQRVFVKQDESGVAVNKTGTITRICTDGAAWIALENHTGPRVKALPEDCELPEDTHKERRTAARAAERPQEILPALFGRDHWSVLLYIESRCVDNSAKLAHESMRCSPKRHPMLAERHHTEPCSPTRLRGDKPISDHDDWDCAEDMLRAGWLLQVGTSINPVYLLTDLGWKIVGTLRRFRADTVPLVEYHNELTKVLPEVTWE